MGAGIFIAALCYGWGFGKLMWLVAFQCDTLLICRKGEGKAVQARLLLIAVQLVVQIVLLN